MQMIKNKYKSDFKLEMVREHEPPPTNCIISIKDSVENCVNLYLDPHLYQITHNDR